MMTCQQLVDLMMDFVSGDLDPDFHAEIREHLQRCASCEAYVETYQITITITRQLPDPPMPSHFAKRLEAMMRDLDELEF